MPCCSDFQCYGFGMVWTIAIAIAVTEHSKTEPLEIQTSKSSVFQCVWHSNVQYSSPNCRDIWSITWWGWSCCNTLPWCGCCVRPSGSSGRPSTFGLPLWHRWRPRYILQAPGNYDHVEIKNTVGIWKPDMSAFKMVRVCWSRYGSWMAFKSGFWMFEYFEWLVFGSPLYTEHLNIGHLKFGQIHINVTPPAISTLFKYSLLTEFCIQ